MKKIKLIDFLEYVNFRDSNYNNEESTKIIRIYYPESPNSNKFDKDMYFEFGIYDYSYDTRKRIISTINPQILNYYVYEVGVNSNDCLEIYVETLDYIEDINLDFYDYPLDGYNDTEEITIPKIYVCSPLKGDFKNNVEKAKKYCRFVTLKIGGIPICPHIYFTRFLNDDNSAEREIGIELGLRLLKDCDEMIVFDKYGISEGMQKEIEVAKSLNIHIIYESKEVFNLYEEK
jgi:hypothetical protein